jgi:tetratricopeptide (TPR) repeat protein
LPIAKSKAEAEEFNAITTKKDAPAMLAAAAAFEQKYPASQLMGEVMGLRMSAYLSQKKFNEAIDELEKARNFNANLLTEKTKETPDKNSPLLAQLAAYKDNNELQYYKRFLDAAQADNNVKLTQAIGERILAKVPTDIPTLLTVARVIAGKPPKDEKEKAAALDYSEEMGQTAVNYIVAVLNSPNATAMPPEQRNEWHYRAHSLMGLIYTQKQAYGDAEKAYKVALSYKKNDSTAYYYLGYSYYSAKKYEEAIDAALKSAFLKGPLEAGARDLLRELYRVTKKNVVDLDKDIQAAGERLPKV